MKKIIQVGTIGAMVSLFIFSLFFIILVGGETGSGKEPNIDDGNNWSITVVNGIGFPYAEGVYVALTQGFWTNLEDAKTWWGNATPPYTRGVHPAVDYSAGYGTQILSVLDGVVVYTGYSPGFGNHIIISSNLEDGSKLYVLYGHFSQILARIGEKKTMGDVIGLEGSTGLSEGSHLHIEISTEYNGVSFWGTIDYRKLREE